MNGKCLHQQRLPLRFVLSVLAVMSAFNVAAAAWASEPADVNAMIERSLPYLHEAGMEWRNDKKCTSCHTTTFTAWALNRASDTGFAVETERLRDWNEWSRNWKNHVAVKRRDEVKRGETLLAENDSVAQLLLGRSAADGAADWAIEYRGFLAKSQNDNGSWKAGGQLPLQKRPKRETQEVSTMWALLALQNSGASQETMKSATTAANKWLNDKARAAQAVSTEWWATQLLLQQATGDSVAAEETRRAMLDHQREDGGWGWLVADDSDALGTGLALYALSRAGGDASSGSVSKALAFLQSTQEEDGSWPVNGTKKNSADHVTSTATYWGTCWAVIALTEFVDQRPTANSVSGNTPKEKAVTQ